MCGSVSIVFSLRIREQATSYMQVIRSSLIRGFYYE